MQAPDLKKIFTILISDRGLVSRIHKEFSQLNKTNNSPCQDKWAKYLNFPKEDCKWSISV